MIDGKAISRKHVTLSVSPVKAGNGVSFPRPGFCASCLTVAVFTPHSLGGYDQR